MTNLKTDSPLSRRIARSFIQFLQSVEPSDGVDTEALDVARECLSEVFKVDVSSIDSQSNCDSLIDIFSSLESTDRPEVGNKGVSDATSTSSGKNIEVTKASPSPGDDRTGESHFLGKDELFGKFFGALEKIEFFRRMPDGSDDQIQLDKATSLFHNAVEEMQIAGCQTFDLKNLAEAFKSQGNKAMQSKIYHVAAELYNLAIALCEDNNAVYYCNRAAAFTQMSLYGPAVRDCLKSIEIDPQYSKAYSRLGFAYYAQGKYRDAIDKGFTKALQLDPNNDSVKENIRAAEQKLKVEQQRARRPDLGESSFQFGGGSRSHSAFNINGLPINGLPDDIANILRNVTGQRHDNGGGAGAPDEPGINIGGNINLNVNELPEELSGAFRTMMGREPEPHGNQQGDSNGRSNAN